MQGAILILNFFPRFLHLIFSPVWEYQYIDILIVSGLEMIWARGYFHLIFHEIGDDNGDGYDATDLPILI